MKFCRFDLIYRGVERWNKKGEVKYRLRVVCGWCCRSFLEGIRGEGKGWFRMVERNGRRGGWGLGWGWRWGWIVVIGRIWEGIGRDFVFVRLRLVLFGGEGWYGVGIGEYYLGDREGVGFRWIEEGVRVGLGYVGFDIYF